MERIAIETDHLLELEFPLIWNGKDKLQCKLFLFFNEIIIIIPNING